MTSLTRIQQAWGVLIAAIRRHGGGWHGLRSVVLRTIRVGSALGISGLLRRLRAAHQRDTLILAPVASDVVFAPALPLERVNLHVGIMAHIFYPDLIEEFAGYFSNMPCAYSLLISVIDETAQEKAQARFSQLPNVHVLQIRVVPNRGRDIAPLLLTFREEILALDLLCHVHTKKSLYTGSEQLGWREYLLNALLGSSERVSWILGSLAANKNLGMIFPESYASVPLAAHTWLANAAPGHDLAARLGFAIDPLAYLDFPAGSMFWCRVDALKSLLELDLTIESFPPEQGQIDGTLQHAVERMFGYATRQRQLQLGILPRDGRQFLLGEGERNRHLHFDTAVVDKIDYFSIPASLVSFDIFDTLVLRPFLTPQGSRRYLAHRMQRELAIADFAALREEAETRARLQQTRDPTLGEIYQHFGALAGLTPALAQAARQLELAHEQHQLRSRNACLRGLQATVQNGRRVIAISDMYLSEDDLRAVLPAPIVNAFKRIYVSCETGRRKDQASSWTWLAAQEGVTPKQWLHIGDNENSDIHQPMQAGLIQPVHVLRPEALFSVLPALRVLRPNDEQRQRWQDQLWLGLLANHFSELADADPACVRDSLRLEQPESLGYCVLGPLLLDYTAWLARLALQNNARKVLFLSREGYVLEQAFQRLRNACPALRTLEGSYLFASRRGIHLPATHQLSDLAQVFDSTFTGPLEQLLDARLGSAACAAVAAALGPQALRQEVYLPDMREQLLDMLKPAATAIETVAAHERNNYLAYWHTQVQPGDAPIVADIGYAGTIQHQLSRLTGMPLGGAYFAAKSQIAQVEADHGWAAARYFDARTGEQPGAVMQQHLLLESILTAPDGQFSHIDDAGQPQFRQDDPQHHARWPLLARIHAGALRFVDDVIHTLGDDALEADFDRLHIQQPLAAVASGRWQLGDWAQALAVEDRYTGRNQVTTKPSAG